VQLLNSFPGLEPPQDFPFYNLSSLFALLSSDLVRVFVKPLNVQSFTSLCSSPSVLVYSCYVGMNTFSVIVTFYCRSSLLFSRIFQRSLVSFKRAPFSDPSVVDQTFLRPFFSPDWDTPSGPGTNLFTPPSRVFDLYGEGVLNTRPILFLPPVFVPQVV